MEGIRSKSHTGEHTTQSETDSRKKIQYQIDKPKFCSKQLFRQAIGKLETMIKLMDVKDHSGLIIQFQELRRATLRKSHDLELIFFGEVSVLDTVGYGLIQTRWVDALKPLHDGVFH